MKTFVKFSQPFQFVVFFALICSNCSLSDKPPCANGDCLFTSFSENYFMNFEEENVYFIKGIVIDKIEYGCKIQIIEDLKGNFPKNVDAFIAWGDGAAFIELNRFDNLSLYDNQDTLLMLVSPAGIIVPCDLEPKQKFPEKNGDFTTLTCACSVLQLSNDGYVTGYISPFKDDVGYVKETMKWEELKELLKEQNL